MVICYSDRKGIQWVILVTVFGEILKEREFDIFQILHTDIPRCIVLHFITLRRYGVFYILKVYFNPALSDDGLQFLAIKYFNIKVCPLT